MFGFDHGLFIFLFLFIHHSTLHGIRNVSVLFTLRLGSFYIVFSLPFTTHGVEDTTSLIDWHLSFSTCFLNDFFFTPFSPFKSGLHSTCRIAGTRRFWSDIIF